MQTLKRYCNYWLIFLFLLVVLMWAASHIPAYNPLKDWNLVGNIDHQIDPKRYPYPVGAPPYIPGTIQCDQVIIDDVTNFLQTYPYKGNYTSLFRLYENGTGEHAVDFVVQVAPYTVSRYALFYDKENKRVKAIKFGTMYAH